MKLHQLNEMHCPICGLHVCKCDVEEEEVDYMGKKITVGKHKDITDHHYDAHELAMGIEDEMQHTKDERAAKSIAKDHLSEIPDYYSRQRRMNFSQDTFKSWAGKHGK